MGEQKKGYIVAGTMSSMGEEVSARGKIMVFDVMEVISNSVLDRSFSSLV